MQTGNMVVTRLLRAHEGSCLDPFFTSVERALNHHGEWWEDVLAAADLTCSSAALAFALYSRAAAGA
eukprot:726937-Prorocentrum_lima.AAC.1